MLNSENIHGYADKRSRSIYIGKINRTTLNKSLEELNKTEENQYTQLQEQMIWGKEHGFNLVLTKDSGVVDCWMIKDESMDELNPIFKQCILEVF